MTRKTQLVNLLSLGSALLVSSHAYAQNGASGSSGASGSMPMGSSPSMSSEGMGSGGAAGGGASVSNTGGEGVDMTTTTTTEETTTTTLPNTGGEPWLMALSGSLTAASALFLRRKLR